MKHKIDKRKRCHFEARGGVTSDGALIGAMNHTVNRCPRQRNTPIQSAPNVTKSRRTSQIPNVIPTSDIIINPRICHRRLLSIRFRINGV